MKNTLLFLLLSVLTSNLYCQDTPKEYFEIVKIADSLFNARDFKNASLKYSDAFKANYWRGSIITRYNAASAWAIISQADSAFYQINRIIAKSNFLKYDLLISDTSFNSLRDDKRWEPVIAALFEKKTIEEKNYNRPLIKTLDSILIKDQFYRGQLDSIEQKYGVNSKEIDDHWKLIAKTDSLNQVKVIFILDNYGWLGSDVITDQGNATLFLVIQHADLNTQQRYLPMMKEALKNGNAYGYDLALLEDRVNLGIGRKQVYGSQIGRDPKTLLFYVQPLDDPDNVDKRRAEVGLNPIAEYVSNWSIKWDADQYKKDVPKWERKYKKAIKKYLKETKKT